MRPMKLCYSCVSLGLTVLWLVWGGGDSSAGAAFGREALVVDAAAELDEPEPYVSPKGRFRFRFPGKPVETETKADTNIGPMVTYTTVSTGPAGGLYAVGYFDITMPAGRKMPPANTLLEGAIQGQVRRGNWTVSSKKSIKIGEYPGIDVTGDVHTPNKPDRVGRLRIYLVGKRVYTIILKGPKSSTRMAEFQKALDTFELLPEGWKA
jgi:hypothetical protein